MRSNTKLHTTCPKLHFPTLLRADQALFRPVKHFKPLQFCFLLSFSLLHHPSLLHSPHLLLHPSYHLLYHPHHHPHHHPSPFIFLTLSPHPPWMRGSLLWGGSQLDYQASVAVSTWLVEDELRHSIQSILSPKETRLKGFSIALQLILFYFFEEAAAILYPLQCSPIQSKQAPQVRFFV